ncbi:MAG: VOC family protein, partial [Alphaproteobacteria bacterium]|nr:VOC family protein [Alphaproteobacteria bacterium]
MVAFASLGHVALRVRDIERSIAFYSQRLGMAEMLRLNYDDGTLFLVYLRITDSQYLELFPYGEGAHTPGREVVAINHFCLTVDDLEATVAGLAAAGVPLTRPLKMGVDGNRQAWIEDPDGTRIELMEMGREALQFHALAGLR